MKTKKDNKTNRIKHIAFLLNCNVDAINKNLRGSNGNKATKYLVNKLYNLPNLFLINDLTDLDNESNKINSSI